ncbi:MAG: CDP-diglyceride synthetase [Candidatus Latescibacterota bacterium]|jgi:CDP-diglyceride synthetase
MFGRVIAQKDFWKSVLVLGVVYALVLFFLKWVFSRFNSEIFQLHILQYLIFIICGFTAGIFSAYGKYWAKLKRDDRRK